MKVDLSAENEQKKMKTLSFEEKINIIPLVTSSFILVASATLLLIWLLIPSMKAYSAIIMKANTALGLALSASALLFLKGSIQDSAPWKTMCGYFLAISVLLIGLLTGVEYAFVIDLGIDQILVNDFLNSESLLFPGRMSPISAFCFVLLGISLVLINMKSGKKTHLASLFVVPLLLISMFAVFGYIYGEETFYKMGPYVRISWQSALGFFILTVGLIFSRPTKGPLQILTSRGFGGITARRLFPVVIASPVLLGWIWLYLRRLELVNRELGVSLFVVAIVVILLFVVGFTAQLLDSIESVGKKVSEKEQKTQQRFIEVINHAPLFVWVLDENGIFTLSEGNVLKYSGLKAFDFMGRHYQDIFKGNEQLISQVQRVFRGEVFTDTAQIDSFDYLINYMPIKNDEGEINGISAVSTDITEQQQLRSDLQSKTAFLETIVDQMPTAVAFAEAPSGKIIFSNSKFDSVWHRPINHLADIEQYKEFMGFHSDGRIFEGADWPLARAINKGEVVVNEDVDVILGDGARAVIRLTAAPVRNLDGQIIAGIVLSQDVTEIKKTARALVQSQKELANEYHKFESIFVDSPASMALLRGEKFIFEKVNPKYKELMGGRELVNKSLHEALPELIGQPFHDLMKEVFETGKPFIANEMMAKLVRRPGGEPEATYFDFTYSRVNDSNGKPYGIYIHAFEITDKVQTREALKLQTLAFELALKEAPLNSVLELLVRLVEDQANGESIGSIMLLSENGKYFYHEAAPNLPKAFSDSLDAVEAVEVGAMFGFNTNTYPIVNAASATDLETDEDWAPLKKLAAEFDLKTCQSVPIISPRGQLLGNFAIYKKNRNLPSEKDNYLIQVAARTAAILVERHNAEVALEEIQSRLKLALVSGNIGFWDWNAKTGYVYLSDTLMKDWEIDPKTFDHKLEEVLARIHEEDRKDVWRLIEKSTFDKKSYDVEFRVAKPNGEIIWINAKGRFTLDENERPEKLTGITINITERKIAEETLKEALRARDEFLSIASHELKTPLTSLKLQTQLHQRLINKGDPRAFEPERINDIIRLTEKQITRLTRLVDDMLDVARIRSGKLTIERELFDIVALIEEMVERMKHQFTAAQYPIPLVTKTVMVLGNWDRFRMEQVMTNLLTNAIRYGNRNPIEILCDQNGSRVRIEVIDGGIGIQNEMLNKIFDRFERGVNSNEISGLGLGLFITKQIVIAHGGKIWAESKTGLGSKFIVELPIVPQIKLSTEIAANSLSADPSFEEKIKNNKEEN